MCGIAGISGEHPERIHRMTAALIHRGPDGNATCVEQGVSLGHARLAILDPRPEGNQPMWNEEHNIAIIFNGEIYNFQELRHREHLTCKTDTDTEVLLKLYKKKGVEFLEDLRGMFAFAIIDCRTHTWHIARDASGIKPLYIATDEWGDLHVASEMRALLAGLPHKPALDTIALSQYMRLQYVPGPRTLVEGIASVPPGTVLSWQNGRESRWSFSTQEPTARQSATTFKETFPAIMDQAVKRHLIADKPIGMFLSGGMDSSILLHHMRTYAAGPVRTYTVRFEATDAEGAQRFNTDADLARLTATHYDTLHTELLLTAEEYRREYRATVKSLDLPNADAVSVAQYVLAREAKKHVDVVLTGAGGDELFGGYPRYRIAGILQALRWLPPTLRAWAGKASGFPPDVLRLSPGPALAERLLARPAAECATITKGEWFNAHAVTDLFTLQYTQLQEADPVRTFMECDRHLWLVDESLRLTDAVTMGNGLEARVPFLDPLVIGMAHAVSAQQHVSYIRTKALLKDTYRPLLPSHLYTLPKASFYPPLAKWLRRETAPLIEEALANRHIQEMFDTDALRRMHVEHKNGAYHLHALSTVMQLGFWLEEVYEASREG